MTTETPTAAALRKAGKAYLTWQTAVALGGVSHLETLTAYSAARRDAIRAMCDLNNEHPGCVRWDCAERERKAWAATAAGHEVSESDFDPCENPEHAARWEPQALNQYQEEFIERRISEEAVKLAVNALRPEILARA